jgi:hypothetical protein
MFIRSQLLYDRATRIIVYQTLDGPRATVPEVSEDLLYCIYAGEAPNSFSADRVLDHVLLGDFQSRNFRVAQRDADYPSEMPRLQLLAAKCNAIGRIYDAIRIKRRPYAKNLPCHDEIYAMKEAEARELQRRYLAREEGSARPPTADGFPFVKSYAELYGMAPIDAAEFMLFKADERRKMLQVTEHMRLYWTKEVIDARSVEEVDDVNSQMIDERFRLR